MSAFLTWLIGEVVPEADEVQDDPDAPPATTTPKNAWRPLLGPLT